MRKDILEALTNFCNERNAQLESFPLGTAISLPTQTIICHFNGANLQLRSYVFLEKEAISNTELISLYRVINSIQMIRPTVLKVVYVENLKRLEICFEISLLKYMDIPRELPKTLNTVVSLFEIVIDVFQNYMTYKENPLSSLSEKIDEI